MGQSAISIVELKQAHAFVKGILTTAPSNMSLSMPADPHLWQQQIPCRLFRCHPAYLQIAKQLSAYLQILKCHSTCLQILKCHSTYLQVLKCGSKELPAAFRVLEVLEDRLHRVNGRSDAHVKADLSVSEEGDDGGRLAGCGCAGQQHLVEVIVLLCYPKKQNRFYRCLGSATVGSW